MSILYLHIGGTKTGSTWIQSVLRINRNMLLNNGIFYPQGTEWTGSTDTSWTSGNGADILNSPESLSRALKEGSQYGNVSLLYSNELLPKLLGDKKNIALLENNARLNGFNEIRILYFLRNPVSFAVSAWHQQVKYLGSTMWLDECIKQPNYVKRKFSDDLSVLENLSENDIFKLTALNYNQCSSKLLEIIAEWTGIPTSGFTIPEAARINRSLTYSELRLQIAMNRILGENANFISRALTESLTEVTGETITPSTESQKMLWERVSPFAEKINKYMPKGHHIEFDDMEYKDVNEKLEFSPQQIDLIGKIVAEKIQQTENKLTTDSNTNNLVHLHEENSPKKIWIDKFLTRLLKK